MTSLAQTGTGAGVISSAVRLVATIGSSGTVSSTTAPIKVKRVIWKEGASPNYCELEICGRIENFQAIPANTPVIVNAHYSRGRAGSVGRIPVFAGRVTGLGATYDPDSEVTHITCLGPRWDLAKDFVKGQERLTFSDTGKGAFTDWTRFCVTAFPCVFNANGKGNKAPVKYTPGTSVIGGLDAPVFHHDPRVKPETTYTGPGSGEAQSILWTLAEAIDYIYAQRTRDKRRDFRVDSTATVAEKITGDPLGPYTIAPEGMGSDVLYHIDVEDMDLASAIDTCISSGGYRWWVQPIGYLVSGEPVGILRIGIKDITAALAAAESSGLPVLAAALSKRLYLPDSNTTGKGLLSIPPALGGGSDTIDGPDIGASASTRSTSPNNSRGTINQDYSRVVTQVAAYGAPTRVQFEALLNPGWRVKDEAALVALSGGVALTPVTRALVQKALTESTSESWEPSSADPAATYYRDVGRLFMLDQTGYERLDADGLAGGTAYDYIDAAKAITPGDGGFEYPSSPRPRPFLSQLLRSNTLGSVGDSLNQGVTGGTVRAEILLPDREEDIVGGFIQLPEGGWTFDPDRGALRITDANICRRPFFDSVHPGPGSDPWKPFAQRIKIKIAVENDYLLSQYAGTVATGGVNRRVAIQGDREFEGSGTTGDPIKTRLDEFASRRLAVNSAPITAASFSIPFLTFAYRPGDWITKIVGRGVDILGQISEVQFDSDSQDTHIQLEDVTLFISEAVV